MVTVTPEAALWLALGFVFARAFGKGFDQEVKRTRWFTGLKGWQQWFISSLLDFLHHWWAGLLLWFYGPHATLSSGFDMPLQYFGLGVFLDDAPDVPKRFRRYFAYLMGG